VALKLNSKWFRQKRTLLTNQLYHQVLTPLLIIVKCQHKWTKRISLSNKQQLLLQRIIHIFTWIYLFFRALWN